MPERPIRVQMLGLLPSVLEPCGPTCARPFMGDTAREMASEEVAETPRSVQETATNAHHLAEALVEDFGGAVQIEVVGLDSPKGLWLGLRHRVGRGFAIVIDGREVLRDEPGYEQVKGAVHRAIRARRSTAAQ